MKLKLFLLTFACIGYSLSTFACPSHPHRCNHFQGFHGIKQQILSIDKTFQWNTPDCKIVGTESIFPRKNKNGTVRFEKGLQVFVYKNDHLKFICVPGWKCNAWKTE